MTVSLHVNGTGHGNRIVQLAEMKNSECKAYKVKLLKALTTKTCGSKKVKVGKYCHDCGCTMQELEGELCDSMYLDAYHSKKHKCGYKAITKKEFPHLNSQAAEQLWSKIEKLQSTISHFCRPRYRFFLRHLCLWRNDFTSRSSRESQRPDINPAISKRRASKRYLM